MDASHCEGAKVSFRFALLWMLLALSVRDANASPIAILIRLDDHGEIVVRSVTDDRIELGNGQRGLILWSEGERDRWQFFADRWERPRQGSTQAIDRDFESQSRGSGNHTGVSVEQLQSTTLLAQLSSLPITRGVGGPLTPGDKALLLSPRVTFRREGPSIDEQLPEATGVLRQANKEVLKIRFAASVARVRWDEISNLPEGLKSGLPSGAYEFELTTPAGAEHIAFTVADPEVRERLLGGTKALAALLPADSPLTVQVEVEQLLGHRPALLADALDRIEDLADEKLTPRLVALKKHISTRIQDPGQRLPLPAAPGDASGDSEIDAVRARIAASQWEGALEDLESLEIENSPSGLRRKALVQLYRGVILSESGVGKEHAAAMAFRDAIQQLSHLPDSSPDLYRAHNNLANFLLSRSTDLLHNHAFQMASGVQLPLLSALQYWIESRENFQRALAFAEHARQKSTLQLNLARQDALLADIVRTLSTPDVAGQSLPEVEKAATERARQLAGQVIGAEAGEQGDRFMVAVAEELLAQISFRAGDTSDAEGHTRKALALHLDAGSLTGLESAYRLLGLCLRGRNDQSLSAEALQHFLVSEQLSDILRDRYPADQVGVSRAGFFARRAYVIEHIAELLIGQGKAAEALTHVERGKARALQDALAVRRISVEPKGAPAISSETLLSDWPAGTLGLEYFLGSERSWVFVIRPGGDVQAYPVADAAGRPIPTRTLVRNVQKFISYVDLLGPGSPTREGEGRRIASGGKFDWGWQQELHKLFNELIPSAAFQEIGDCQTLLIVPHHVLHYFPFAALVTSPDDRPVDTSSMPLPTFLIDEPIDIVYSPSIGIWRSLRQQPNRALERVQAIGVVDFNGQLNRLPGVDKELLNLRNTFGSKMGTVLSDEAVTSRNIVQLLGQPGILSISTHGMKEPDNPLESFLVCRDEGGGIAKFRAIDMYGSQIDSDLIILNACYGGFGNRSPLPGDDVCGIQRALLQGGARTVISGLWDIYDSTTPELMADVYRQINDGHSATAALSVAQRNYLKLWRGTDQPTLRFLTHPYYWAVFTAAGDDRTGAQAGTARATPATKRDRKPPVKPEPATVKVAAPTKPPMPEKEGLPDATATATQPTREVPEPTEVGVDTAVVGLADDPEFQRFVNSAAVREAIVRLDASSLADLALQTAEGERVLGRPCKAGSFAALFVLAARTAVETKDEQTLRRLERVADGSQKEQLKKLLNTQQLHSSSRGGIQMPAFSSEHVAPDAMHAMRQLADDVTVARITGDQKLLDLVVDDLATIPDLNPAAQAAMHRLVAESRGFFPNHIRPPLPGGWVNPEGVRLDRMSVGMEVLVAGKALVPIRHQQRGYLAVPELGVEYTVRIANRGPRRVLAILSVDGLSVMNGQPWFGQRSGYIVNANSTLDVSGWRRGPSKVAAFRFDPAEKSYAAATGRPALVGTIRLVAIEEEEVSREKYFTYAPGLAGGWGSIGARSGGPMTFTSPAPTAGTGYGRELDSRVTSVDFRTSNIKRVLELSYDTSEGLAKAGVPLADFTPPPPSVGEKAPTTDPVKNQP